MASRSVGTVKWDHHYPLFDPGLDVTLQRVDYRSHGKSRRNQWPCELPQRTSFSQPGNLAPNIGRPLCDSASVASSCSIPVFHQHAVSHSDNIGGDPISRASSSRKPTMDDRVIVFSNDHTRLVLQRRRCASNQVEQAVAPWRDVRAVLNVVRRPVPFGGLIVPLVEKRIERFENQYLIRFCNCLSHSVHFHISMVISGGFAVMAF